MISRLFKRAFFISTLMNWGQLAQALDYNVSFDYRAMNESWSLLPTMPASFQSAKDISANVAIDFGQAGFEIGHSNLDLILMRKTYPKDVSLSAKKEALSVFYYLSDYRKITVSASRQVADQQRFSCYGFNGIVIGSCEGSDFQIRSAKKKYNGLGGNLLSIDANTSTIGLSFSQLSDSNWLDIFSVGLFSTNHNYKWLTPVEDISPFILDLKFNGIPLRDSVTTALNNFPQRDSWRLNQLNISGMKAIPIAGHIKIFAEGDLVYLDYEHYRPVGEVPDYNLKIRAGLRFHSQSMLFEVYGNYYHRNLIGFESITFNQRTEHYFDRPYGNLGVKIELVF